MCKKWENEPSLSPSFHMKDFKSRPLLFFIIPSVFSLYTTPTYIQSLWKISSLYCSMGKLLPVRNESIDPKLHISACHLHHKASVMAFPADSNLYCEETQICLDEFMLPEQMFFPSSKWSCQDSLLHHVNINYDEWYHSVFFHFYIKGSYIRNVVEDSIIIKESN